MTKVEVFKKDGKIMKVTANGHSGYGVAGEDIVCAGVSSIIQTAMLGLIGVVKIPGCIKKDEQNVTMEINLPDDMPDDKMHDAQVILETMLCGISDLHVGFSDFIELEVKSL